METWLRPIEPKQNGQYSYAIAFVSLRRIGMPVLYSIALSDLGLTNPNGYTIKVGCSIGPSVVTRTFKDILCDRNTCLTPQC